SWRARDQRIRHGETVCLRSRGAYCIRRCPDSRWQRVHQRLCRREVLPRRQIVHHRRRHQRNPAAGDRATIAQGLMRDWADKIAAGDIRALARAASVIENRGPETSTLLRELAPQAGRAVVVGVTGPPGAGKSTLVDALASLIRRQAKTLGIIAVD